jgi:hypothetical protein
VKDLGEPRELPRFLRPSNRAFGSLPYRTPRGTLWPPFSVQHSVARPIVNPIDRSSYSRRVRGKSTAEANFFISILGRGQLDLSAFVHGVIPNARVFTSGGRDLAWTNSEVEETKDKPLS